MGGIKEEEIIFPLANAEKISMKFMNGDENCCKWFSVLSCHSQKLFEKILVANFYIYLCLAPEFHV